MPFSGLGAGRGDLDEILIFPFFPKNEDRNVLGMEETRFKTDHSQHGNDKKNLLGDYPFMRPKLILFVLILQKKDKEEVLVKVSFSVR